MKSILLINSSRRLDPILEDVFSRLYFKGWNFFAWTARPKANVKLLEKTNAKISYLKFGPNINNRSGRTAFLLLLPFLKIYYLAKLFFLNKKRPIGVLIAVNLKEKILFSSLARWFKIKLVFIELPENDYLKISSGLKNKLLTASGRAKVICFNNNSREKLLRLGVKEERINIIQPGTKISAREQPSLYNALAEGSQFHKKFFTIGTIADLDKKQKIEILFKAVKECSLAIPNLQLVIIGDGKEKKNLSWTAKQLKIDTKVWFISEPNFPKKWLDNFEIYVSTCDLPRLNDFFYVLQAMSGLIPVIAPAGLGFEDLIVQNKTGSLIEMDLSEMLARQIIKLYQNKNLRTQLGENALKLVDSQFSLDKMIDNFEKALL